MTADDIDQLYGIVPEDFMALRTELVAAAKKRGDVQAAKAIAAARRPTTAAWVLNMLVRTDGRVTARLSELTEGLRAAHAEMSGARIRELSAGQRRLIDELARAAFAGIGMSTPSAALRDEVEGTLQAAIADPDVAARLGRLAKAERWSGFGDFGSVSTAEAAARTKKSQKAKPEKSADPQPARAAAARKRVIAARAEAAEQANTAAVEALSKRTAQLATARRRYEKLLESLAVAERELNAADAARQDAQLAATAAERALNELR